jgi:hypothetical protein
VCWWWTRPGRCAALAAEIGQAINELAFDELDAPRRTASHCNRRRIPFAPVLERAMLVDTARIAQGVRAVSFPAARRCPITGMHGRSLKSRSSAGHPVTGSSKGCRRAAASVQAPLNEAAARALDEPVLRCRSAISPSAKARVIRVAEGRSVKAVKDRRVDRRDRDRQGGGRDRGAGQVGC